MIMSVSTFWMSSGAVTPLRLTNSGIPEPPEEASISRTTGPADSTAAEFCALCSAEGASPSSPGTGMWESSIPRTSVSWPVTAAAAAITGEQRWVRPPAPWRPSKLRLEVEAHRSFSPSLSGFIARHIEQPGCRKSKPASTSVRSSPSSTACSRTTPEPGTTIACTCGATLRPLATAATARKSSMRPLVQEPMKTLSTGIASSGSPCRSSKPMYESARSAFERSVGSSIWSRVGTLPLMGAVSSGEVPQVTVGAMEAASMTTVRSYAASASEASERQCATAASHSSDSGAGTIGRPRR
mmetsp:Transcript_20052/g.59063  ORF Transcript_20052/g.59063 Transcript_20052/m.59063 type:complete len:298 (+) Transcript_20052:265-1158(+)